MFIPFIYLIKLNIFALLESLYIFKYIIIKSKRYQNKNNILKITIIIIKLNEAFTWALFNFLICLIDNFTIKVALKIKINAKNNNWIIPISDALDKNEHFQMIKIKKIIALLFVVYFYNYILAYLLNSLHNFHKMFGILYCIRI